MNYPEDSVKNLVERVPLHRWTGNDEKGKRRHNGPIPREQRVIFMELHWRRSDGHQSQLIGGFRLNLERLLREGYLKTDPTGEVRLSFLHDEDGGFYVGRGMTMRRLRIG